MSEKFNQRNVLYFQEIDWKTNITKLYIALQVGR